MSESIVEMNVDAWLKVWGKTEDGSSHRLICVAVDCLLTPFDCSGAVGENASTT